MEWGLTGQIYVKAVNMMLPDDPFSLTVAPFAIDMFFFISQVDAISYFNFIFFKI